MGNSSITQTVCLAGCRICNHIWETACLLLHSSLPHIITMTWSTLFHLRTAPLRPLCQPSLHLKQHAITQVRAGNETNRSAILLGRDILRYEGCMKQTLPTTPPGGGEGAGLTPQDFIPRTDIRLQLKPSKHFSLFVVHILRSIKCLASQGLRRQTYVTLILTNRKNHSSTVWGKRDIGMHHTHHTCHRYVSRSWGFYPAAC